MVAEDEDEASKTEEPSERKISKAKEEGDIAISQDAKSFIMLTGMLFVVWLILPDFSWGILPFLYFNFHMVFTQDFLTIVEQIMQVQIREILMRMKQRIFSGNAQGQITVRRLINGIVPLVRFKNK